VHRRLSSYCRLILFDRRGTGASDPVSLHDMPPLEGRWEEIRAVMDAAGSERAVILGMQDGGPPAMLGAATVPDRVSGLILFHCPARYLWAEDYPIGFDDGTVASWREMMGAWDVDTMIKISFPSRAADERTVRWGQKFMRLAAAPTAMLAYLEAMLRTDVRDLLPSIRVPTLVLHRRDYQWLPPELDRFVADHIDGARFAEMPGSDAGFYFDAPEAFITEIADFLSEVEPVRTAVRKAERLMATVLLTDIVSSTNRAQEVGDATWVNQLQLHDDVARELVEENGGRVVKSTGDGILAVFELPGRGLSAAAALATALDRIGMPIRSGLHTGEIEVRGQDVAGIGVHIAARVMATASAGEILVSRTVRDLVVGSEFRFIDRGPHHLKGVEGDWQLFALTGG